MPKQRKIKSNDLWMCYCPSKYDIIGKTLLKLRRFPLCQRLLHYKCNKIIGK